MILNDWTLWDRLCVPIPQHETVVLEMECLMCFICCCAELGSICAGWSGCDGSDGSCKCCHRHENQNLSGEHAHTHSL